MIQKMTATFQFPLMEKKKKRKSANEENQREYKYELIIAII